MDLVVTVPKFFWKEWLEEGDAAGDPPTGQEWGFYVGWKWPRIFPGDRLYIVAWNQLRGFSIVTRVGKNKNGIFIAREGGAMAVTITEEIRGFRGYRKCWWSRDLEIPFIAWKTQGVDQWIKK